MSFGDVTSIAHTYATIFNCSVKDSLFAPNKVSPAPSISAITLSIETIASRIYRLISGVISIGFPLESRNKLLVGGLTPTSSMNAFPHLAEI